MQNNESKSYKDTDLVRDLMSNDVDMVSPSSKVTDAARQMRDMNVGSMPVTDRQELVGIITDRDIAVRVTADGANPDEVMVKEVMSTDLVTVRPDQTAAEAAQLMSQHQVRRLPVVEDGKLIGMLALGDLATDSSSSDEAAAALSDISSPSALDSSMQQGLAE